MANRWLQSRLFECAACEATYLHDLAYRHSAYECLGRRTAVRIEEPDERLDKRTVTEQAPYCYASPAEPIFADVCSRRVLG